MSGLCWLVASEGALDRWAPAFEAEGVTTCPLIVSRLTAPPDPAALTQALRGRGHDLVFLTSANAVAYVDPREARGWSAACVGARTAHAAHAAGFELEFVGGAGAEALAQGLLAEAPGVERVLFLCGANARDEGPAALRAAGVEVDEIIAYAMAPEPGFGGALAAADVPTTIVVGSPEAADAVLDARPIDGARFVTLGETTRAHLLARGIESTCSASPRVEDLVTTVVEGAKR